MKKQSFFQQLKTLYRLIGTFSSNHAESLSAVHQIYVSRPEKTDISGNQPPVTTIKIESYGSIFKVINSIEQGGSVAVTTQLATYGWHSNGHLIGIGKTRHWIFDPKQGKLYVEDYNEDYDKQVQVFQKI